MATPNSPGTSGETTNVIALNPLRTDTTAIAGDKPQPATVTSTVGQGSFDFLPIAELVDSDESATIRLELPGVGLHAMEVDVSACTVEVSGVKKSIELSQARDRYRSERSFGSFKRSFVMPFVIASGSVEAKLADGVLTIEIAKPPQRDWPKYRIEITT